MLNFDDWIKERKNILVNLRRDLHSVPEQGWTEYVTTSRIYSELEPLGFKLYVGKDAINTNYRFGVPGKDVLEEAKERAEKHNVPNNIVSKMENGNTGVIAIIDTGKEGPHISYRFDIDALPIEESNEKTHFPFLEGFSSKYKGMMHACGHDGHTAIGLLFAHFISENKEILKGTFTLIFQPAEEGCRGSKSIIENGWIDNVDYFISSHIGIHDLAVGEISATTTDFLSTTKFDVSFKGLSTHAGATPELGKNSLLAASNFIQAISSLPRHSEGPTRVNIGTLKAGSSRNIIPDFAFLEGEVRGGTTKLNNFMFNEVKHKLEGIEKMYGVKANLEVVGESEGATCDEEWKYIVKGASRRTKYIKEVHDNLPLGASEDITQMINHVQKNNGQATYFLIGTSLMHTHHNPKFDFEEESLLVGLSTYISLTLELLNK